MRSRGLVSRSVVNEVSQCTDWLMDTRGSKDTASDRSIATAAGTRHLYVPGGKTGTNSNNVTRAVADTALTQRSHTELAS